MAGPRSWPGITGSSLWLLAVASVWSFVAVEFGVLAWRSADSTIPHAIAVLLWTVAVCLLFAPLAFTVFPHALGPYGLPRRHHPAPRPAETDSRPEIVRRVGALPLGPAEQYVTRSALSAAAIAAGLHHEPHLMLCADGGLNALVAEHAGELTVVVSRAFTLYLSHAEQEAALVSLLVRTRRGIPSGPDLDGQLGVPPELHLRHATEFYLSADRRALKRTLDPGALLSALTEASVPGGDTTLPHVRPSDALALWVWPWSERMFAETAGAIPADTPRRGEYYRSQGHRPERERIAALAEVAGMPAASQRARETVPA